MIRLIFENGKRYHIGDLKYGKQIVLRWDIFSEHELYSNVTFAKVQILCMPFYTYCKQFERETWVQSVWTVFTNTVQYILPELFACGNSAEVNWHIFNKSIKKCL